MNAIEAANALGLTGTDAEIVATLQTLSRSNIAASSVRRWLRQDREPVLLAYDGSAWYGTLQDMLQAGQLSAGMQAGLRDLKALMLEGGDLRTTQPGPAGRVHAEYVTASTATASPASAVNYRRQMLDLNIQALHGIRRHFRELTRIK